MEPEIRRSELENELLRRLDTGRRVILLAGPRGSGKTTLLHELRTRRSLPRTALVQLELITASPEILCDRFLKLAGNALRPVMPGPCSYTRLLACVSRGHPGATLLLDEITELRTLSYFPGVRRPLGSFLEALCRRGAPQCLATSRFPFWLRSHLRELPETVQARTDFLPLPPLTAQELQAEGVGEAAILTAATGGLPISIGPLLSRLETGQSLTEALAQELEVGGRLEAECRATLGELLHRARGYGACKASLHVLSDEEGLTLSEIARRLQRKAGSTRDYLRWLEEVELIAVRRKRFYFVDPVLRLWLRLYGKGSLPSSREIHKEVESHLEERNPEDHPIVPAPTSPSLRATEISGEDELIEID
ncbi:MAG: hypothetical protein ACE5JI_06660 [Acidobacteriota bacterium]